MQVIGMVTADVLADDSEYAEIIADLRDECNRHAPNSVLNVKVPRPPQPALSAQLFGQGNFGKASGTHGQLASFFYCLSTCLPAFPPTQTHQHKHTRGYTHSLRACPCVSADPMLATYQWLAYALKGSMLLLRCLVPHTWLSTR